MGVAYDNTPIKSSIGVMLMHGLITLSYKEIQYYDGGLRMTFSVDRHASVNCFTHYMTIASVMMK